MPSIIIALLNLDTYKIFISNRTQEKANAIKNKFKFIEVIEWGKVVNCDLYINSTSIGLKSEDRLSQNFDNFEKSKIFYDVIYNPPKTAFLLEAEKKGHKIINGRDMFLYQAQMAFNLWHNFMPDIDKKVINYLYND